MSETMTSPTFPRTKAVHCNLFMLDGHPKEEIKLEVKVEAQLRRVDDNVPVWFFIDHPWRLINLFFPQKVARMRTSMSECADAFEEKYHDRTASCNNATY